MMKPKSRTPQGVRGLKLYGMAGINSDDIVALRKECVD